MTLDEVAAELLAGPLNEFTSRRNAKAKELKSAGQAPLATDVTGLKKPPVAIWAVNQLARQDRATLERMRRAGQAVVQAQAGAVAGRKNAAPELRAASEGLQRELESAVRATGDLLRKEGHAADEATLRRIQEMLRVAAVSSGDTWDRLHRGALIVEPRAGEDMITEAFALAGVRPTDVASRARRDVPSPSTRADDARAVHAAARQAADTEKRVLMEHAARTAKMDQQALEQAEQTARRLRDEADRVAEDAKRIKNKVAQADKELERAKARAKASRAAARRLGAYSG
jgi:hypothetical protein